MQKDHVVEGAESAISSLKAKISLGEKRVADSKSKVLTWNGNLRTTYATEAATRQIEVDVLKEALVKREKALALAVADQPRRDAHRKDAARLEGEADALELQAAKLRDQLAALETQIGDKRQAAAASLLASQSVLVPKIPEAVHA